MQARVERHDCARERRGTSCHCQDGVQPLIMVARKAVEDGHVEAAQLLLVPDGQAHQRDLCHSVRREEEAGGVRRMRVSPLDVAPGESAPEILRDGRGAAGLRKHIGCF